MTSKTDPAELLRRWRQPGSAGFFAWLDDVKPLIPSEKGPWQQFEWPNDTVKEEVRRALDGDFSTIVWCWPRRHGKTVVSALVICWRFLTRAEQVVAIVANSEKQTTDTAFRLVKGILEKTPFSKTLVDSQAIRMGADTIEYAALGSRIQGFPSSPASLFGKKLNLVQCSELHAARNDATYQAIASAIIDSDDGLALIDSTVGSRRSPLYMLYQLWKNKADAALYYSHIFYSDLEDAVRNGPAWIAEKKLRSRAAQMLPLEFGQQHLNTWGDAASLLFPEATRKALEQSYPLDPAAIADGRPFVVGAGLDRASGLVLTGGDSTVTACVLKVVGDDDEAHVYVIDVSEIAFGSAGGIKRRLSAYAKDFGLKKAVLEASNVVDILSWCQEQSFEAEAIFPTRERQAAIFQELHRLATEGRLHIHPKFKKLFKEMETFEYRIESNGSKGSIAVFEHAKGAHDDAIFALAWAIYSLREVELNPFELDGIYCNAIGPAVRMCILNGGDHIPLCASECKTMAALNVLYEKYSCKSGCAVMALPDFYNMRVTNTGPHVVSR